MKVKTYKSESLQEGLDNIKRDLGSDALILSTRSVSVRPRFRLFKRPTWEITAAVRELDAHRDEGNAGTLASPPAANASAAAAPAAAPVSEPAPASRDPRIDTLID